MDRHIYHLLTEIEPFSRFHGGAISRWVGSTVADDQDTSVLCTEADDTWAFAPNRVRLIPALAQRAKFCKAMGRALPWPANKVLLSQVLKAGLNDLKAGDVVWVHNRANLAAAISSYVKKRGARLVLHMHNSHLTTTSTRVLRDLKADRTVFCSKFLEAEALQAYPRLGATGAIPNGADEDIFYPPANPVKFHNGRPLEVLFVGRLVPDKGAHVLVHAMRLLADRNVPARARIVGSGWFGNNNTTPYVDELHRVAPANVEFAGYVDPDKLGDEFRQADILCCPSVWNEPFGMINVEAMATRIPVVATRCGGIPEIFAEGGALLVEPNSPQEIADACERLIEDARLREQLAEEGFRSFQRNYTWRSVHQHYREVVEALPV